MQAMMEGLKQMSCSGKADCRGFKAHKTHKELHNISQRVVKRVGPPLCSPTQPASRGSREEESPSLKGISPGRTSKQLVQLQDFPSRGSHFPRASIFSAVFPPMEMNPLNAPYLLLLDLLGFLLNRINVLNHLLN